MTKLGVGGLSSRIIQNVTSSAASINVDAKNDYLAYIDIFLQNQTVNFAVYNLINVPDASSGFVRIRNNSGSERTVHLLNSIDNTYTTVTIAIGDTTRIFQYVNISGIRWRLIA